MTNISRLRAAALLAVFSAIAGSVVAQTTITLIVNGHDVGPAVFASGGRTYVDADLVAHAMNGSVTLLPDHVILNLPAGQGTDGNRASESQSQPISRDFASGALNSIESMRDWKVAVETMVRYQWPADQGYFQNLQHSAEEDLRQLGLAALTPPDHQAYQVLQSGYALVARWTGSAITTRQRLDATRTLNPDYLKNDTELQKINDCGRALAAMLASRQFADIPSCH